MSQVGLEICLQRCVILIKISIFGASNLIIVSQESGQQYIAVLMFCPPSTFILDTVDINMEVSDRNHCVNKFISVVKLCISIWGFMEIDSPPVQPQVAVQ